MNKTLTAVLILAVVVIGGYFLMKSKPIQAPSEEITEVNTIVEGNTEGDLEGIVESANTISYSDEGYAPNTITIKVGDTVTFKNESSMSMWPASASHPTHGVYPTTGGCLGSTFDACRGVLPGESWSFKFDEVGDWKYHDHLKPKFFGTIIVEA